MTPQVVAIVALSAMLLVAVSVALVAVWSAKGSQNTAEEAIRDRRAAVDLLVSERRYIVALETYLPGQPNEGMYVPTGGAE